ncbi:MAG: DUF1343 domain-containing protein, partial [Selenomonas sp.]|nr:DUF1343 domain-containing protein [Selenomonas sp.]
QGLDFTVIPCRNYTHQTPYTLPVPPSPNLPNMKAVYLYPSLCPFEGTFRGIHTPMVRQGNPRDAGVRHACQGISTVEESACEDAGAFFSKYQRGMFHVKHSPLCNIQFLISA